MSDQNKINHFEITVEPKADKNNSYVLREKNLQNNKWDDFLPVSSCYYSFLIPNLRFKVVNIKSNGFSVGVGDVGFVMSNTDALVGEASLLESPYNHNSIFFFGSDKKIKNFDIKIKSVKSLDSQGFEFYAYKPENTKDKNYEDKIFDRFEPVEETIYITIYLHSSKYKKIKHSLEKGFIKEIDCAINLTNKDNTSYIRDLYIIDNRLSPYKDYKILLSIDDIKNKADLPENFNCHGGFYQHDFSISITENLVFGKLDEDDDLYNEDENNSLSKTERTLLSIEKQSQIINNKLIWILAVLIMIIIFKH